MKIMGVDFTEMAEPASLKIHDTEIGTVFRMTYAGLVYQYTLSHFELINLNSNDLIIKCITNIINEGKHHLGINDSCNEST